MNTEPPAFQPFTPGTRRTLPYVSSEAAGSSPKDT